MTDPSARAVDCTRAPAGGQSQRTVEAPADGRLTARLQASDGDWDLAIFRRGDSEPVAASTYSGAEEVAGGLVRAGERVVVQACRRSGRDSTADVRVDFQELRTAGERETPSLVRVSTPTGGRKDDLQALDLDLTEHAGPGFVDVVLYGDDDAAKLRGAGFSYKVQIADLAAQDERNRLADERYDQRVVNSLLPSMRTTYRRVFHYSTEMKNIASANPGIAKLITLRQRSGEGRPIEGLEISSNPGARDGKPVFLLLGSHHSREWPAAEMPMEWAYSLVQGYNAGIPRFRELLANTRAIIVPVVQPDGYNDSREDGQARGNGGGFEGFNGTWDEFRRKTCRLFDDPSQANCDRPPDNSPNEGVDLNRNYAGMWGGFGSSTVGTAETYRGVSPFSEPEAQNIRELISSRQVTMMITHHTFGDTILRQPGVDSQPLTPDEPQYKSIGDAMAAENGYESILSKQLYDHGGTTDNWSYYATGGFGFVYETHPNQFHGPFADMVADYDGTSAAGGGTQEAFFRAQQFAADPATHVRLTGRAPPGSVLRLRKEFQTATQEASPASVTDRLNTTMVVPGSGSFEWRINQSTRPIAEQEGKVESWTLTCELPEGTVRQTQSLVIDRGQSRALDLSACGRTSGGGGGAGGGTPAPRVDAKELPRVRARMSASFNGRVYTIRVRGSLLDVADRDGLGGSNSGLRCEGDVRVTVRAKRRRIASGLAPVDGECGYERAFRIKRKKLPRALRRSRRGLRSLSAVARFGGGPFLQAAERSVSTRVKRPRRRR